MTWQISSSTGGINRIESDGEPIRKQVLPTVEAYHERRAERGFTGNIRPCVETHDLWHRRVCQYMGAFALGALVAAAATLVFCYIYHWKG